MAVWILDVSYRPVGRDAGRNGALGTAVAREGGARDLDLVGVGAISPAIGSGVLSDRRGGREGGKEEGDGTHIDDLGSGCLVVVV